MKVIKYNIRTKVNHGTEEESLIEETFCPVIMGWNEINEEIAKREAYKGEYTIEDDGAEEAHELTEAERIEELEEALALLLSGVTE